MGILKRVFRESLGVESQFKHRAVLFIPSESYDAATITIMQGLEELGFTVYTIKKGNINSWWMNKVIDDPHGLKIDFVLWNMHWGTRWGYFDEFKLGKYLNVLIDGCDNRGKQSWKDKYYYSYCVKYGERSRPPEPMLSFALQKYRWMEPLGKFKPDIVFTSQKNPGDRATFYLPFGIHREALVLSEGKSGRGRKVDFANVPGPGTARQRLTEFLKGTRLFGRVHNASAKGMAIIPNGIEHFVARDANIHSWHRWVLHRDYFRLLNNTKIFIYPNVYDRAHWDSKRVWEALASGCFVLFEKPRVDMVQYPVTELCLTSQFSDYDELVDRANWLYSNQGRLEQMRLGTAEGARRYFSPVPIARYFLHRVLSKQKGK